jgi:sarcosine oxidase subunit alpha
VNLQVLVTPVTSAWGNCTVAGRRRGRCCEAAGFDAALAPATMKHMTIRETQYDGARVRVLRASFSGELGYEINVPR